MLRSLKDNSVMKTGFFSETASVYAELRAFIEDCSAEN